MISQTVAAGTRERLAELLAQDLSFANGQKTYGIHTIHSFAARFPPQLPRHFILGLTEPGETILDPMAGSGATLVEAWLNSRNAIGVDLDPLALRLCKTKTFVLAPQHVEKAGKRVLDVALFLSRFGDPLSVLLDETDEATRKFIDYWFTPVTQRELAAIVLSIREEPDRELRRLLEVLFSAIIITKSGGVSLARDLAHTRPHRDLNKTPRSAFDMFRVQLERAVKWFGEMDRATKSYVVVVPGDCRFLPLASDSIDLVVTSPPYANAIDYMRAHKFSLVWLGRHIGELSKLRHEYIGAEKRSSEAVGLPEDIGRTVSLLGRLDSQKAEILVTYFKDMVQSLGEIHRVLRPGKAAVIVVGPSTIRGLCIPTHTHLASIAQGLGFEVIRVVRRPLDRNRRMMPARHHNNGQSQIEQRMYEEFVMGLVKPE